MLLCGVSLFSSFYRFPLFLYGLTFFLTGRNKILAMTKITSKYKKLIEAQKALNEAVAVQLK